MPVRNTFRSTEFHKWIADCGRHDWIVTDVQRREGLWLFQPNSERQAIRVPHRVVLNNVRLARELAVMGLGVVLMPEIFGADAVHQKRLVRVMVPWQIPPLQVTAIVLSRDRIPKRARVFLEFFAERARAGKPPLPRTFLLIKVIFPAKLQSLIVTGIMQIRPG